MTERDDSKDDEVDAVVDALHEMLRDSAQGEPSTSALGRTLKLSGLAARTASTLAGARLRRAMAKEPGALMQRGHLRAAERLVTGLGEMKGLAMKAGQMASYIDPSLPPEMRRALALLQTQSQRTPFSRIRETVESELDAPLERHFAELEPEPVAAASIGQVHRGRLHDGRVVAVKVQHPGIEETIDADLKSAAVMGRLKGLVLPRVGVEGVVEEMRARFMEECDYEREAEMQQRFGELFADHPDVTVPRVFEELSSRRVLTTEFHEGRTFHELVSSEASQQERDRIGEALYAFYLGTLYRLGLFNADPHPGNYLFPEEGGIVILDYGCIREFEPGFVQKIKRLLRAVVADEPEELHASVVALGIVKPGVRYHREDARELFRYLYAPLLRTGRHRITQEYAAEATTRFLRSKNLFKLTMPGEMLFLNRVNFGLMSIFAELGAEIDWRSLGLASAAE